MKHEIVIEGRIERFPWVCSHCGLTYWYRPNDELGNALPVPTKACMDTLFAQSKAGEMCEGRAFWHALFEQGIKKGRELERKDSASAGP